jgi:NADH:ubiquinone oxidoreductase subunit F (NADH-binding)
MALCGYATGAETGYLYLIEDMRAAAAAVTAALDEARTAALTGAGLGGGTFSFEVRIHLAPTTYVAGEESATLDAIEGGPGRPRGRPPYPGERGLFGRPTTVQNVETLAHVPAIVKNGSEWYRRIGRGESTGTMLFTLDERVNRPGVYELPFGATYRDLLYGCGGGPRSGRKIRAVLPAVSCAFISAEYLDTPIDHASLASLGSSPGCGGVSFIEEGEDVLKRLIEIARFFKREQCGQCPPCRLETSQIVHILERMHAGEEPAYRAKLARIIEFSRGKGLCSLVEMAAAPVQSALALFAADLAQTAGRGRAR